MLFDAKICFRCRQGARESGDRQHLVAFDADSAPAQELLAHFKAFTSAEPFTVQMTTAPELIASSGQALR